MQYEGYSGKEIRSKQNAIQLYSLSLKCRRVSCDPSGPRRPRRRLPHAATANLSGHSDRQMVGHDETLSLSSGRDI